MTYYYVKFSAVTWEDPWTHDVDIRTEELYYDTREEALKVIEKLKEEYGKNLEWLILTTIEDFI